ncbi:hypothetical protein PACTADRAFT_15214 [Pachysolen tannophilus NRRL Y-2460]|uniref:DNA polymerase epsilon subunit D n=1 Tax=Pachysolen tannophilus NRRL Y-2460 TaxID=669874 RepID=A0A1E4TY54_PACTA|nr:hypothetical protein PACTADRAFT_15214 [Pachysolen tannophilus NRRL Y-2460]
MPAKGWRKSQAQDSSDGNNPSGVAAAAPAPAQQAQASNHEIISIDEILFPKATIARIAKSVLIPEKNSEENEGNNNIEEEENLPEKSSFILAKDSLTLIQRSSVVYISHLFHHATQIAKDANRKTVNAQDIINALELTGFDSYIPIIKDELENFTAKAQLKKKQKQEAIGEQNLNDDKEDASVNEEEVEDEETKETEKKPKKLKDNKGNTVAKGEDTEKEKQEQDGDDDDDDDDDDNGEDNDEANVAEEEKEEEEEEDDDDDDDEDHAQNSQQKLNPSQILEKEHIELEGEENENHEENFKSATEGEDEDDEEDDEVDE